MQIWNMHNPFRACLVLPDGHMVLWDYKHAPFLAAMNPLVAELRSGAAFIYSLTGDATDAAAGAFAAEVADVLAAHAGGEPAARRRQDHAPGLPGARRRAASPSRTARS